ncbi:MAG: hypothetical protein R3Y36_04340 [Spirochaetales bacterium]
MMHAVGNDGVVKNWIIAATPFESNIAGDSESRFIPQNILQNILLPAVRNVTQEEHYRREQKIISEELQTLYGDVQKKTLERDSLLLTISDAKERDKAFNIKDDEINALFASINAKKEESSILHAEDFFITEENIALWKNDSSQLYTLPEDISSYRPDDIDALITGRIIHSGSFLYVEANLFLYPGGVAVATVSETGSIATVADLSFRLTEKLYEAIVNAQTVSIDFFIEPQQAGSESTIYIGGTVLRGNAEGFANVTVPAGIYEFYVESPGYESVSGTYSFSDNDDFSVQINLQEYNPIAVNFNVASADGSLYMNALSVGKDAVPLINSFPVLGEFVNDDGVSTWFFLSDDYEKSELYEAEFSFEPDTKDFAEIIEKKRRIMYNSYAALIVSLPLAFIADGQYLNEYNAFAIGQSSGNKLEAWTVARYATMGVSIGLGINFLIQLGLYIYSANTVLPEEVMPITK